MSRGRSFLWSNVLRSFTLWILALLPTMIHGNVGFYALNAFSANNSLAVTIETCAYNATNSRLCVTTPIYTLGSAGIVFFETPSTVLFNLSAIAYYTTQPNDIIATVNINTYNITEFNFFLVLYVDGFTQPKPGVYGLVPVFQGFSGPPIETKSITLMTLNLFYSAVSSAPAQATIPSYYFYTLDGTMVYSTPAVTTNLLFLQSSTVTYTPSTSNGDANYMYDVPFEAGWMFSDGGGEQIIGGGEANCYRGQLFANIGTGHEFPNEASIETFALLRPPLLASPPTFLPTAVPSYSYKPTVYPTQAPSTIAPTDHSKTSSLGNLSSADIAGVSIGIVCGVIILVALIYFVVSKYYGNNKKDTEKTDLVGNERL